VGSLTASVAPRSSAATASSAVPAIVAGTGIGLKGGVVKEQAVAEGLDRAAWEGQGEDEPESTSASADDVDALSPDEWTQLLRDDAAAFSSTEVRWAYWIARANHTQLPQVTVPVVPTLWQALSDWSTGSSRAYLHSLYEMLLLDRVCCCKFSLACR
jgi:hypothetical protein